MMKKLLSVLAACALAASLAAPASAASAISGSPRIERIRSTAFYNFEGHGAIDVEQVYPGDEIIIPLVKEGFEDETGALIDWDGNFDLGPTVSDLKRNSVTPNLVFAAGGYGGKVKQSIADDPEVSFKDIIRDVEIVRYKPTPRVRAQAAVRIRFVERLVGTAELNFSFRIRMLLRGSDTEMDEKYFHGMISNYVINITPATNLDYADAYGDVVLYCTETTDNVKADMDVGVYAYMDMVSGAKFYGYAEMDGAEYQDGKTIRSNDPVVQEYDEIRYAYRLTTVNVKNQIKYITVTLRDDVELYVYNIYGEFIGMSNEKLPYSNRYYMATKEVEIDPDLLGKPNYEINEDLKVGAELRRFLKLD